jgi:hypothetical protein
MKKIVCEFDFVDLLIEAEGQAWDGWFCPIWANIEKNNAGEDIITLSLGAAVSRGTSFLSNDGGIPASWVGNIECWFRQYDENDAENWAEDTGCDPEDFDSDNEMEIEADCMEGNLRDKQKEIQKNIIEYAKCKGFEEVEFE